MRIPRSTFALALIAIAAAAVIACGGSSKKSDTPTIVAPPTDAIKTIVPNIPPLPTLSDPEGVALVPRQGSIFKFNISLPADWRPGDTSNGLDRWDIPNAGTDLQGNPLIAGYTTVSCHNPVPPEGAANDYSSRSLANAAAVGKAARPESGLAIAEVTSPVSDVQVGSLPGAGFTSTIALGQLKGRIDEVWVATPQCAWQINISIYSPGDETPYFDLFNRILDTFQPQGAG